jgi:hypothetical protein
MSYDPRKPRPNPEIKEILRCIKRGQDDLQAAENHTQRIGYARILKAHLEMLEDEPETFTDLQPGTVEVAKHLPTSELLDSADMTEESPFDTPGDCQGMFFFYANGGLSNLYRPPLVDPYQVPLMHGYGCSYSLEKLYACPTETTHHFTDPYLLCRYVGSLNNPDGKKSFWLLSDPRGVFGGASQVVKMYATRGSAVKAADRLGERLDIRFLVAQTRLSFLNR